MGVPLGTLCPFFSSTMLRCCAMCIQIHSRYYSYLCISGAFQNTVKDVLPPFDSVDTLSHFCHKKVVDWQLWPGAQQHDLNDHIEGKVGPWG